MWRLGKRSCTKVHSKGKENAKNGIKVETIQAAKTRKRPRKGMVDISSFVNFLGRSIGRGSTTAGDEDKVAVNMEESYPKGVRQSCFY